jgi:hypothetical protein
MGQMDPLPKVKGRWYKSKPAFVPEARDGTTIFPRAKAQAEN